MGTCWHYQQNGSPRNGTGRQTAAYQQMCLSNRQRFRLELVSASIIHIRMERGKVGGGGTHSPLVLGICFDFGGIFNWLSMGPLLPPLVLTYRVETRIGLAK